MTMAFIITLIQAIGGGLLIAHGVVLTREWKLLLWPGWLAIAFVDFLILGIRISSGVAY